MRILYFIFYGFLNYCIRLFYRKIRLVNATTNRYSSTIYVSNHPSAFMDPLIIAALRKPIVFFMTRSDVFNKWTSPILSSAHMIPIYRQHDGGNAMEKNKESFKKATEVLSSNRSLLIFGEGLTDDVFERRLKPLKKGALRIGFTALEETNWEKEIRIVAVGCNYTNPNVMRSDLLISESKPLILNDFKDQYLENPAKTINELNRVLESMLITEITHIERDDDFAFHEQVMMLTRKGMNPYCFDDQIPLEKRWNYSKDLAHFLNQQGGNYSSEFLSLRSEVQGYFNQLKQLKTSEMELYHQKHANNLMNVLKMLILSPFAFLGMLHSFLPFYVVKRFVEKSFKRKVFWNSTKMLMTMLSMQLFNLPILVILPMYFGVSFKYVFVYYLLIGILGLIWYQWLKLVKQILPKRGGINQLELENLWNKRAELITRIQTIIPVNIS
ncbi:MAG: 1-acyl-sn-glycerol-3-phosphate acyltransferase [Flavobacteriales bacterium]